MQANDPMDLTDPRTHTGSGYPLPTDERALADRERTGCQLRRGLCLCPAAPFAYAGCERVKIVGGCLHIWRTDANGDKVCMKCEERE
jgi:hypothetical protein